MKCFEWTNKEPKDDVNLEFPYLLWIYDNEIEIGYVDDGLAYWCGGRWVNSNSKPAVNHPDFDITYWCKVPMGKNSRKP